MKNGKMAGFAKPWPRHVADVRQPVISLTDGIGNEAWSFLDEEGALLDDVLSFCEKTDHGNWKPVRVPGELAMQGFDIENNTEYYYQRRVEIPADYTGKLITLQFDGVYSDARVWVNQHLVAGHSGGFTSWSCEITEYVVPGEAVTLTVGVADLEGMHEGIYNPDGKQQRRNPAWASFYAHHNVGGILRDISLLAFPQEHIVDTIVNYTFSENYGKAELEITCVIMSDDKPAVLEAVLSDQEGTPAHLQLTEQITDAPAQAPGVRLYQGTLSLSRPHLWDAEHPYLYTLETRLVINGAAVQENHTRIGLREILYGGKNGTDTNKVYVNGKQVKLRGVCRHDMSWDLGRSMTKEQAYAEIKGYKECNINFIRTSHYPASRHTLDACDEMGLYVEQETAACFQGDNGFEIYCEPEEFLHQCQEMVYADRNRACIIIWSIGNESGFEKTEGFRLSYDFVKKTDMSRPVIFSYPYTVKSYPAPYDIFSKHYEDVTSCLGNVTMPVLHDEFAHIPCYNMDELRRDPNVRNFWGHSIQIGWKNIMEMDGALGCALWSAIDDVFCLPEHVPERMQKHSEGRASGYGEWGCIFDIYMRKKPEAFFVKKAFSPIQVKEDSFIIHQRQLLLPVKNWFDHTNLKELTMAYVVDGGEAQSCEMPDIPAHGQGVLVMEADWDQASTVKVFFSNAGQELIEECLLVLKERQACTYLGSGDCPQLEENETDMVVTGKDFSVQISKVTGQIVCGEQNGYPVITGGPFLHTSELYMKEFAEHTVTVMAHQESDRIVIDIWGTYENELPVQFCMSIYGDAKIVTTYTILDVVMAPKSFSEVGISYELAKDTEYITWDRKGQYQNYPENHLGRNKGTAYKNAGVLHGYREFPEWDWKDDRKDYFIYANDDKNHGITTNDFKAMRENIWNYEVHFKDTGIGLRVIANADRAVRIHNEIRNRQIPNADRTVQYTGAWKLLTGDDSYLNPVICSSKKGDRCEFEFDGTGVAIMGRREKKSGIMSITIDGISYGEVNTVTDLGHPLNQQVLFQADHLEPGLHTICLCAEEDIHGQVMLDYFEIMGTHEQGSREYNRLIINNQWSYPSIGWGNWSGRPSCYSKGTIGDAIIQFIETP